MTDIWVSFVSFNEIDGAYSYFTVQCEEGWLKELRLPHCTQVPGYPGDLVEVRAEAMRQLPNNGYEYLVAVDDEDRITVIRDRRRVTLVDWRRPDCNYTGLPPRATYSRGLLRIQMSPAALAYIAEDIMPDDWGLDPLSKKVVVHDPELLTAAVLKKLNAQSAENGSTLVYRLLEQALTRVMEDGDPGLEVVECE